MKSNYKRLGDYIRQVDVRNKDLGTSNLLGINIDKFFMPSVANIIGTDLRNYKLIRENQFACNPMHVGRDERIPVALYLDKDKAIVSPAYFVFEIVRNELLSQFLMLWFRRPEFDRECWFYTDASVRGGITWEDFCEMRIPVPPIEEQKKIVDAYESIENRIALKRKINDNLEEQAFNFYKHKFEENRSLNIENGWRNCSISYFAPIITGKKDANTTNISGKYPFFSCSQDVLLTNEYSFDGNAVLVAGNGDFNIKWYCGKFEAYQRTYVLIPTEKSNYALLYYALKYHLPEAVNSARGSVISFITKGILEDIKITIPKDTTVLSKYCNVLDFYNKTIDINKKEIRQCITFLQMLLSNMT